MRSASIDPAKYNGRQMAQAYLRAVRHMQHVRKHEDGIEGWHNDCLGKNSRVRILAEIAKDTGMSRLYFERADQHMQRMFGKTLMQIADDAFIAAYSQTPAHEVLALQRDEIIRTARKGYAFESITRMVNAKSYGAEVSLGQVKSLWISHAHQYPSDAKLRQAVLLEAVDE